MKIFLLFISLLYVHSVSGSCFATKYTLTEMLAHVEDENHIFTCDIIATYIGDSEYTSIAVVTKRYKGNPADTVYIQTGGFTSAGGMKIPQGTSLSLIHI